MLVQVLARYVHTEYPLVRVDLSVKLEHFLHVLGVDDQILRILVVVLRHGERRVDVYLRAVDRAQKGPHDDVALVLRLPQVVVEDVRGDRRMDQTVQRFDC